VSQRDALLANTCSSLHDPARCCVSHVQLMLQVLAAVHRSAEQSLHPCCLHVTTPRACCDRCNCWPILEIQAN
jgi:hypothetical protein